MEKNQPAIGDSTIMIMENVNDSKEISVALCSEGNICCSFVFVRTCKALSASAVINPPIVMTIAICELFLFTFFISTNLIQRA